MGLLLLSKVVGSNPEPFKPHYKQFLQLFGTVLQDLNNPTALYYCILTLTTITAYTGTEEMVCYASFDCCNWPLVDLAFNSATSMFKMLFFLSFRTWCDLWSPNCSWLLNTSFRQTRWGHFDSGLLCSYANAPITVFIMFLNDVLNTVRVDRLIGLFACMSLYDLSGSMALTIFQSFLFIS